MCRLRILRVGQAVTSVVAVHRPEVTRLHVPHSPRQVTPETAGAARDQRSLRGVRALSIRTDSRDLDEASGNPWSHSWSEVGSI